MTFSNNNRAFQNQSASHDGDPIDCPEALILIDTLPSNEAKLHGALSRHIAVCPSCSAAMTLETNLRRVIAPKRLPKPSMNFETMLAMQLDIKPSYKPAPDCSEVLTRNDSFAQWSWVIAVVTLSLVGAVQIQKVMALAAQIPDYLLKLWAIVASHLTGEAAVAYSYLTRHNFNYSTESITLIMGVTLIAVSVSAAKLFPGRED